MMVGVESEVVQKGEQEGDGWNRGSREVNSRQIIEGWNRDSREVNSRLKMSFPTAYYDA